MDRTVAGAPAWLVLPTYNEAENLEALVAAARANLPGSARILVVDDNSPDGTGEIADRLAADTGEIADRIAADTGELFHMSAGQTKGTAGVEVLHRSRKEGLGPAYIAGFRHALAGGAGLVIEMDSDFSHDPADLPRLLAAAEEADVAIGSRYVPGGGVSDWGALRRGISRFGSTYSRLVLGLPIRDLTGGFKCFRREVLESIDLDSVDSRGYAFQVELTYRAVERGFRVLEVPITFRERRAGTSKMNAPIVAEAIWRVPLLRYRRGS